MAEKTITAQLLGKNIDALKYADLEAYFTKPRNENIRLEFKSYVDDQKKGPKKHLEVIYEGISAMLNSEGGVIIWGAPVGVAVEGSKEKAFHGALTSVDFNADDDQMNDGILNNLSPMPPMVTFKKLTSGKSRIYVIEVPRSPYAPHQYKGTYFARFGASTRTAPHYLVEALMRKITYPNIAGYLEVTSMTQSGKEVNIHMYVYIMNFSRYQNDENVSLRVHIDHGRFEHQFQPHYVKVKDAGKRYIYDNIAPTLQYGEPIKQDLVMFAPVPEAGVKDKINLTIAVGGKYSPAKYSTYELTVKLYRDSKSLVRPIKRNFLAHDDDDKGFEKAYKHLTG